MKKAQEFHLWRNLIYSLVLFGQIKTTRSRAKAISGLIDKLVNKLKKGTVAGKREVLKIIPQKEAVNKLTTEILPKLSSRKSGYTRILRLGERSGDDAAMVLIQWVEDLKTEVLEKPAVVKKAVAKPKKATGKKEKIQK
ncbi:MAG: 50S ribosomal protein L17 [Patescibacteria group bacterium]|nr:50S ribosomal protein L17 [Patescibacteria group bacterium]MCL5095545.1 50S ribosomal protein L17 [Patescibacteria group bacterium]